MKNLRIVFMGTPEFAVPSLQILVDNGFDVAGVVTAPDRPKGRGKKIRESEIKACATAYNLKLLQPTNLKDPVFVKELKDLQANLQVVVAFRMLPEMVWSMPEFGTFNLHASLLPQYRGAAPVNWAIINGEGETGITTFSLSHDIDTGEILFQEKVPISPEDNAGSLYERLKQKGAVLVLQTVEAIRDDSIHPTPQPDVNHFKKAPKIFREDCEIDWTRSAGDVNNFIRGLSPHPGAWTLLSNGQILKVFRAHLSTVEQERIPGKLFFEENKLYAGTTDGWLELLEVQLQGKQKMSAEDFLRGKPNLGR